ncbi:hypothetical protein CYMTET_56415 [Cymbomonas tetramitiformis]|uniref:LysM domain-containing protein n=1 Tax=Cymbomonas tetramitiformis TaxID=36881 RepID=A0AAE0ENS4_9CHLO|nr:hypothetical protein CYMTET_56415 [Cymbomonas tetramitiformis]
MISQATSSPAVLLAASSKQVRSASSASTFGSRGGVKPSKQFPPTLRKSGKALGSTVCWSLGNRTKKTSSSSKHSKHADDAVPGMTFDTGYWKSTPLHPTPSRLYTFKEGENTWIVAGWMNKSVEEIQELNPGVDLAYVKPGQSIVVEGEVGRKRKKVRQIQSARPSVQPEHVVSIEAPPPTSTTPQSHGSEGSIIMLALICPTMVVAGYITGAIARICKKGTWMGSE